MILKHQENHVIYIIIIFISYWKYKNNFQMKYNKNIWYDIITTWIQLYHGWICIWFLSMSEDVISAMSGHSEQVADIISEGMDKNHIQIHPLI